MSVIAVLRRQKQEDCYKSCMVYLVNSRPARTVE